MSQPILMTSQDTHSTQDSTLILQLKPTHNVDLTDITIISTITRTFTWGFRLM